LSKDLEVDEESTHLDQGGPGRPPATISPPGLGFFLSWALLTALAWGLGWVVAFLAGWALQILTEPLLGEVVSDNLGWALVGALSALILAGAQLIPLRRRQASPGRWLGSAALGGAVGNLVSWMAAPVVLQVGVGPKTLAAWIVTGLIVGLSQWRLARLGWPSGPVWTLLSGLGWGLALGGYPLGVLAAGVLTGLGQVGILRRQGA
jgi:hypothetical protein